MKRKSMFLLLFSALMLVLAACGGEEGENQETMNIEEGASQDTENGEGTASDEETPDVASSVDISASNWKFDKEEYVVKAGEPVAINFTSEDGAHGLGIEGTDINIQQNGQQEVTLEPGEYQIYCSIPCGQGHSDMNATIIVQ